MGGGIKGLLVAGSIQLLLSYFEEVYRRLPRFTQSQAILSVHVLWMQLQFNGFSGGPYSPTWQTKVWYLEL